MRALRIEPVTAERWDDLAMAGPEAGDEFGSAVALSTDGRIMAVGAHNEDGSTKGIGGNQADNSADDSGAVYVFSY